jgi:hypothetical protein
MLSQLRERCRVRQGLCGGGQTLGITAREFGVRVDPKRESYDFGNFGWITDPEGIVSSFGSLSQLPDDGPPNWSSQVRE